MPALITLVGTDSIKQRFKRISGSVTDDKKRLKNTLLSSALEWQKYSGIPIVFRRSYWMSLNDYWLVCHPSMSWPVSWWLATRQPSHRDTHIPYTSVSHRDRAAIPLSYLIHNIVKSHNALVFLKKTGFWCFPVAYMVMNWEAITGDNKVPCRQRSVPKQACRLAVYDRGLWVPVRFTPHQVDYSTKE